MKTIEIKSILSGAVLFSHKSENNTIKKTLQEAMRAGANLEGANLEGAYLEGAYLEGAYLEGAYLEGANLRGAILRGAILEGANLEGANLEGANLEGAYLEGAYLEGANLRRAILEGANLEGAYLRGAKWGELTIVKMAVFTGLYKYVAIPIIAEEGLFVKLGCHFRKVEDWNENFWNNNREFPDDKRIKSELRKLAFDTCIKWIELNK